MSTPVLEAADLRMQLAEFRSYRTQLTGEHVTLQNITQNESLILQQHRQVELASAPVDAPPIAEPRQASVAAGVPPQVSDFNDQLGRTSPAAFFRQPAGSSLTDAMQNRGREGECPALRTRGTPRGSAAQRWGCQP